MRAFFPCYTQKDLVLSVDEGRKRIAINPPYGLLEAKDELADVQRRVRALMDDSGIDSFPSYAQLATDAELYETVMRLGGRFLVSRSMDVPFENRRVQRGTWDLEGIRAQLKMYLRIGDGIQESQIQMPRSTSLMRERRWDLHHAILHCGGYASVCEQLGWKYGRKPYIPGLRRVKTSPTGDELDNALRAFMREKGGEWTSLPRMKVLKDARPELYRGIIRDGGHHAVSERLGLAPVSQKKGPKMSFDDVVAHVEQFMRTHAQETFPSQRQLREAKRYDLMYWIKLHGGTTALARKMGVRLARAGRPS